MMASLRSIGQRSLSVVSQGISSPLSLTKVATVNVTSGPFDSSRRTRCGIIPDSAPVPSPSTFSLVNKKAELGASLRSKSMWSSLAQRYLSTTNDNGNNADTGDISSSPVENADKFDDYAIDELMASFGETSYFDHDPLDPPDFSHMTNEELEDTSTIPGWELIHSPPTKGKVPRGALVGTVVSTKMQKTVNVAVDRYRIARIYRKRLRYTRKFMAHDEHEVAKDGDLVMIVPCHRISKHKHFMLREIVRPKGQL